MAADFDLVIIGTGAAGTSAAAAAQKLGVSRIALVERGQLWGTCVNAGCIPSKFLLARAGSRRHPEPGHPGAGPESRPDLAPLMREKEALQERQKGKKQERFFKNAGIELVAGEARFLSPHELQAGERRLSSERFIIATGSSPVIPSISGIRTTPFLTSADALSLETVPPTLVIVGGRTIGLEFAQLYARLGTDVTILQRSPRIIPEEEPAIADMLAGYLAGEGIHIFTGVRIVRTEQAGDGVAVTFSDGGTERLVKAERLLLATGRSPNSRELGCGNAGVRMRDDGAVIVDATLKTSAPHIWAAGDVTGEPMLETAARYGGEIAAQNAFLELKRSFNAAQLPHGIFTSPQVAGVGMTEDRARSAGLKPVCNSITLASMVKSSIDGDPRGMVKIVAEREGGRILGVHICAPLATEMIQEGVVAVVRGLTADDLGGMPHIYPTAAEALAVCARGLRGRKGECLL